MRFSEMDSLRPDQLDFVPRERKNQLVYLAIGFLATMVVVFATSYSQLLENPQFLAPLIAIMVIAMLGLFTLYRKQKNLDLVMTTEFQNMLFSQAMGLGSSFALIARYDGTIVHTTDGFFSIFPDFNFGEARALEGIFEQGTVNTTDRERVLGAIRSGVAENLIFPITDVRGKVRDYVLSIEPLPRPSGFCIIRGREFMGQRAGAQRLPDLLRSTSMSKIEHLLTSTDIGQYITNGYGQFELVNPAFERICGLQSGEALEHRLSLHHVFVSMGSVTVTEEYTPTDHIGEAALQLRNGQRLTLRVSQHVLRDGQGKIIGATGTLLPATA